jgi:predicted methyltransferase
MPFPKLSDDAVFLLLAIRRGTPIVTSEGVASLVFREELAMIEPSAITELEESKLIEHHEREVRLTESGIWWAKRFGEKDHRAR